MSGRYTLHACIARERETSTIPSYERWFFHCIYFDSLDCGVFVVGLFLKRIHKHMAKYNERKANTQHIECQPCCAERIRMQWNMDMACDYRASPTPVGPCRCVRASTLLNRTTIIIIICCSLLAEERLAMLASVCVWSIRMHTSTRSRQYNNNDDQRASTATLSSS